MADRFYVLNTGNTSDTAHWSATTGGSGGSSVPGSTDAAKFDGASFTIASQIVTVNAAFSCLDMDWTGATNTPSLAGASTTSINGSLTLIAGMTIPYTGTITFSSTTTGKTITTAGQSILSSWTFNGIGGEWTLQDAVSSIGSLTLTNGTLITNGKSVSCASFSSSNSNIRTITLGSSTITCSANFSLTTSTNLTFNANTSTIVMTGASSNFSGSGKTYNNVTISGAICSVSGSNTFNVVTVNAGKTMRITSGSTQTVGSLIANGTSGNLTTLQSVTAGSAATISRASGTQTFEYCTIKDITFTGGATFVATNSIDGGGNTGISFVNTATASTLSIAIGISI